MHETCNRSWQRKLVNVVPLTSLDLQVQLGRTAAGAVRHAHPAAAPASDLPGYPSFAINADGKEVSTSERLSNVTVTTAGGHTLSEAFVEKDKGGSSIRVARGIAAAGEVQPVAAALVTLGSAPSLSVPLGVELSRRDRQRHKRRQQLQEEAQGKH